MCLGEKHNLNREIDFRINNNEFVGGIAGDIDEDGKCKNCFLSEKILAVLMILIIKIALKELSMKNLSGLKICLMN